MSNLDHDKIRGRTLKVYLYVIKGKNPVGPRDVMRGANLSSPSVSYRHLQKLEAMGLIFKDDKGNYVEKEKINIPSFTWIGKKLFPNPIIYSFIFFFILLIEILVLTIHFTVETSQFKVFFLLLTAITTAASILFLIEGLRMFNKIRIIASK